MNLAEAKAMLKDIRELSGLASDEWQETYDPKTGTPEVSIKDNLTGRIQPIAHLLPACGIDDQRLMTRSPLYIRALLTLLDHAFKMIRELQPKESSQKNYAAECAMKCAEPAFKKFLEERHGLAKPLTDDRAANKVRFILNIGSRGELNDDPAAAARWQQLRNDFEAWRKR